MQIVYHIPFAHSNPLPVEGIVLGHPRQKARPLHPIARVAHLIRRPHTKTVAVTVLPHVLSLRLPRPRQPSRSSRYRLHADLHVVGRHTGAASAILCAPGHGQGDNAAARGGSDDGDG